MDKNLPNPFGDTHEILEALRKVIDLPDALTALDISLRMDAPPVISCMFHPYVKNDG